MEDKIDKILENQSSMNTSLAVIEERLRIIGTAAVSISTFIKSMFG
jgi:hypothetical protein